MAGASQSSLILHDGADALELYGPDIDVTWPSGWGGKKSKSEIKATNIPVRRKLVFPNPPSEKKKRVRSIEQAKAKRRRYRCNKLEIAGIKKLWRERREAFERSEMEKSTRKETSHSTVHDEQMHTAISEECDEQETREQYLKLQQSTLCDTVTSNNYSALLLPSFVDNSSNIKIYVEGSKDTLTTVAAKISAEQYIGNLSKERDEAIKQARSYRNQVDDLQVRNRTLYCEMNNKIDVVRNFWRNNIAEGSTRAGRCVQQAVIRSRR